MITEKLADVEQVVEVGQPLFKLDASVDAKAAATAASPRETDAGAPSPASVQAPVAAQAPPAAPVAAPTPATTPASAPAAAPPPLQAGPTRSETRVKMSRMRLRIAERLKEAQNTTAMLTTFQECDMSNLMELRSRFKEEFEKKHGVKLGFMSAFVKASTAALEETPAVNAMIDEASKELVYRNYCDISVAVASPNGLVVPVIRNAEKLSFADIEKTIASFGAKAKSGSLSLEEMSGGTFSISNGGVSFLNAVCTK